MINKRSGFTIVELLIVIVVIAILAAVTIAAYNGIQSRARDSEKQQDMSSIQKVLELYRVDNGGYPYYEDMMSPVWRKANLASQDEGMFINPQDSGSTNSMTGAGGGVPLDKYSFYSIVDSSGVVCRRSLLNGPCSGYRMAWRLESNPSVAQYKNVGI